MTRTLCVNANNYIYGRGNVLLRKLHLFYGCESEIVYGCKLRNYGGSGITLYSFHRLNVCYNNILRRLLRRPRYCSASGLFAECGIPNCKAVTYEV